MYCDHAASFWKMTGMHPVSRASKKERRVGLSPGGCKQNTDWCIALSSTGGLLHSTSSVVPSIFTGSDGTFLTCKLERGLDQQKCSKTRCHFMSNAAFLDMQFLSCERVTLIHRGISRKHCKKTHLHLSCFCWFRSLDADFLM